MNPYRAAFCFIGVAFLALAQSAAAQSAPPKPNFTPFTPFKIVNNVYYVGSQDQSSFLISTRKGLILINSGFAQVEPDIERSVTALGFDFKDVKILLLSHAHIDHDSGSAAVIKRTGARYEVMDADVPVVESGGKSDFHNGTKPEEWYQPVRVDRVLHDGDRVELGGTVLTAHKTAGHTEGCTTWTFDETQDGHRLHVLVLCGVAPSAGHDGPYRLVKDPEYPGIVDAFQHTFEVLAALPCDVFLGAHGRYFGLQAKYQRLQAGDGNAFVDPAGYQAYVAQAKRDFDAELAKQRLAAHGG